MCNLYRMSASRSEVADFFASIAQDAGSNTFGNAPAEIFPGYPGQVMDGTTVRQMAWGFPLQRTGVKGQPLKPKPVNNARADKLASPFWSPSFRARRCLIPVSSFAEAEGSRGAKTRTWFALPDNELFAVAGLWRDTAEWGPAYSMVITDACIHVAGVHDRMPVILAREDWADWLNGPPDAAHLLCRPWPGEMQVMRTQERWAG